jgi:tripartite-type tricarboxylate transporter receptor subunit TctC
MSCRVAENLACVIVAGLGLVWAGPATAQSAADFYSGKTITVLSPFGASGGYGRTVTLLAQHFPRHLPGNPKGVPQYMPGVGGIKMANYLYNVAPKDGTVIALLYDNIPTAQVLYPKRGVKYDSQKFTALGSLRTGDRGLLGIRPDAPVNTLDAIKGRELVMGASGTGSSQFIVPVVLNKTIGTRFKVVTGYKSIGKIFLAMEQKEVFGTVGSLSIFTQLRPEWVNKGGVKWLAQIGLSRHKKLADVPLLQDLTDNEIHKQVLVFLSRGRAMAKGMVAPPGIPPERAKALRTAFDSLVRDPEFLKAAAKGRISIEPEPWTYLRDVIDATVAVDPKVLALTKTLIGSKK